MSAETKQTFGLLKRLGDRRSGPTVDAEEISHRTVASDRVPTARGRRLIALALSAVSAVAGVMLVAGVAPASAQSPYVVNDTVDAIDSNPNDGRCESTPGNCTLRAAIQQAEHDGGGTVELQNGLGDFHLTIPAGDEGDSTLSCPTTPPIPVHNNCPTNRTGDLDIHTHIRVIGKGVADSVIDGTQVTRIFDVHNGMHARGNLELTDLTLQNGNSEFDEAAPNHEHGGAIHNHGTISLERVAVINSTSNRPSQTWGGGGITNADSGDATLLNVTIAGNSTNFEGGGIENKGTLRMFYVTITDNSAPNLRCSHFAAHGLHCVLWQGGGIFLAAGSTTFVADTIVAKNGGGHDCAGPGSVTSSGGNVQGDGSCPFNHATDRKGDPGFDPSALGPPRWFPLLPTSPAVDVPPTLLCGYSFAAFDIRGAFRPQGGDRDGDGVADCDTGSFELEPGALSMLSIRNARIREGQQGKKEIRFIVGLSASPKHTVKVHATTRDGTAKAGSDYLAHSAELTFKPHQRRKRFAVSVIGDNNRERNETFTVRLSAAKGARLADTQATATITNDD